MIFFRYSGCGGNGNNFLTGESCVKTCGGKIEESTPVNDILTSTTTTKQPQLRLQQQQHQLGKDLM